MPRAAATLEAIRYSWWVDNEIGKAFAKRQALMKEHGKKGIADHSADPRHPCHYGYCYPASASTQPRPGRIVGNRSGACDLSFSRLWPEPPAEQEVNAGTLRLLDSRAWPALGDASSTWHASHGTQ